MSVGPAGEGHPSEDRQIVVRWMWCFLDTPGADSEDSEAFWVAVTRAALSPRRGDEAQFATLLPAAGRPWVKVQRADGPSRVHLDLDVLDPTAAAARARALGAQVLLDADQTGGHVVLASPGGFVFCFTTASPPGEPDPRGQVRESEPDLLDQVCLDLPADRVDDEIAFWAALTGWDPVQSDVPEFAYLRRPDGIPLRLLFQRLGEPSGEVRGHVDLACVDREATTAGHVALGARVLATRSFWTVLADPVGRVYCLTDRTPVQEWQDRVS